MGERIEVKRILNCEEDDCPKDFDELSSCGESHLATCMDCFKRVQLVSTMGMAQVMIEEGQKVALNQEIK
tara:strand:+ start:139 stop:348 length:210 start_codon:yes stop_codon:yes gene_type:complete